MNPIINTLRKQFSYYKSLADKTLGQLNDEQLYWKNSTSDNSIAIIINHLTGNMLSRFTDFLTTDGEKEWRNREGEFSDIRLSKNELIEHSDKGWQCLFENLDALTGEDLDKIVYIRNMGHTVFEALSRQLAHYAYHVGQITYIGKSIKGEEWQSLSIPKGESMKYNAEKFEQSKTRKHFTDDYLK